MTPQELYNALGPDAEELGPWTDVDQGDVIVSGPARFRFTRQGEDLCASA